MAGPEPTFPLRLDEGEVRRLSGPATFARADAWQRAGHVSRPALLGAKLAGEVRGAWRRVDDVQIGAEAGRPTSSCSCGLPLCVHAAALLLHWLRSPASFDRSDQPTDLTTSGHPLQGEELEAGDEEGGPDLRDTPAGELAALLQESTMPALRNLARRRRVAVAARTKADLVRRLAAALVEPASVDAALAELSHDELILLHTIHLLGPQLSEGDSVGAAFRALGGPAGDPPLETLLELGLIAAVEIAGRYQSTYAVASSVASRLGTLEGLARPADQRTLEPEAGRPSSERRLDLLQVVLAIVHALRSREVRPNRPAPRQPNDRLGLPPYWQIAETERQDLRAGRGPYYGEARLTLIPPLLRPADLAQLEQQTGCPADCVTLALHVCLAFNIVTGDSRLVAHDEPLQAFLDLPDAPRQFLMVASLLQLQYLAGLRRLVGDGAPFEFHCHLGYFGQVPVLLAQAAQLRRLLITAIGLMAPDVWYDLRSFLGTLRRWAPFESPALTFGETPGSGQSLWWLADRSGPQKPLDLRTEDNWQRVYGRYAVDFLAGALSWLDLIDVQTGREGPRAFRVRPAARAIITGTPGAVAQAPERGLRVDDDLTVLVSAAMADRSVYSLLAALGELVGASPDGLRFRLRPESIQRHFDAGNSGPDLLHFLEARVLAPLPGAARAKIEAWWSSFGRVRLYDDVTLLELADDYLLPELLASTSLSSAVICTLSPRVVAVDPKSVGRLIDELTRAGHPPGVSEGR